MKSLHMTPELYEYVLNSNPNENSFLKELRKKTDALKYSYLRSPSEQISFLTFMLNLLKPKKILEIGTFTGYSTLAMALATPEDTEIITCDINNVFPSIGLDTWAASGVLDRIELRLGLAMDTLATIQSESKQFDFIYIDADKENVWNYFEKSFSMLTEQGVIIVDNVLWRGRVIDEAYSDSKTNAIRDFNLRLSNEPGVCYCLLPIGDGLTLISRDLK